VLLVLLVVIRPLSGWAGPLGGRSRGQERRVVVAYGIRGSGSLYCLAHALGQHDFPVPERELRAVVTFTVLTSVVPHGLTAGPVVARLDRSRTVRPPARGHGRSAPHRAWPAMSSSARQGLR
jgi:NhaP-type Na+/H+ or K+/H+ antiporter